MNCVHLTRCFDCDDHGAGFNVSGPAGTLTYNRDGHLHTAGGLPSWSAAPGYAAYARAALEAGGDAELWAFLEFHYQDMLADA